MKSVLIVAKDRDLAQVIAEALEPLGLKIRIINNLTEASHPLRRLCSFDYVLADYQKNTDFRSIFPYTSRIIIMTGKPVKTEEVLSQTKADAFLKKPFALEELLDLLSPTNSSTS